MPDPLLEPISATETLFRLNSARHCNKTNPGAQATYVLRKSAWLNGKAYIFFNILFIFNAILKK
jgi:hypothetical protein